MDFIITLYDTFTDTNKTMNFFKRIKFVAAIVALLLICNIAFPQDSLYVNFLINRIHELQVKEHGLFVKGLFPSFISGKEKFSDKKRDNNIFYNGLIAYTLKDIKTSLDQNNLQQVDSILQRSRPAFDKFKNQKGRGTYNFWRTDTAFHYPYMGLVNLFMKKTELPDDMDDTVLSLQALDANDSSAKAIHVLMQQYVNRDSNKVRTVIKAYEKYPAYSTWFGKKFPVVFDVSVMCNILAFVQHYNLAWTKSDSASLNVVITTIKDQYHIYQPLYASPYYPKTSLILYHVARLMSIRPVPQLEALKPKLVERANEQLTKTHNLLERIILSSALMKWGEHPASIQLPSLDALQNELEQNDFSFFAGNVPSYFSDWLRKYASNGNVFIYHHYCPAFNDVLLLEYLLLKNKE